MDWLSLSGTFPRDRDLPERAHRLTALSAVVEGRQYDVLSYPFSAERNGAGEYVPLAQRRPSVRTNLCRTVVDDSVSLLFSEGHFPAVQSQDERTREALTALVKAARLNEVMIDAATRGSVGSVAILFRVLRSKPFFSVMNSAYLAPEWDPADPDTLVRVTERYKVRGTDLRARGYAVPNDGAEYWFARTWDALAETWFQPMSLTDARDGKPLRIDTERTVQHGLGYCPVVWIRNLPGGDDVDGACTFAAAIDSVIECDYLLSQAGRGLKYSADPQLVLRDPNMGEGITLQGGAANTLVLPPEGNAELLEINGHAAAAVLEHCRELRALALEAAHGNRAHADKITAAQSGKAIELLHQSLIWLADRLRISYGEGALLRLLCMVCAASERIHGGLQVGERRYANLDGRGLVLKWAPWFASTAVDKLQEAQALKQALDAGIISQQTAIQSAAATYDVEDVPAEQAAILADKQAAMDRAVTEGATVQIREVAAP